MNKSAPNNKCASHTINSFRAEILSWYDAHRRHLPWRAYKEQQNTYYVWLSEIMLQQTVVRTVIPYFTKFIDKWPTVYDLADANIDDVLSQWAGLGYYARARNLHKCAGVIAYELGGVFPSEIKQLKKLPGIGDYTAAAIRAIAFDKPASVIDGNIERVISRYYAIKTPLPDSKALIAEKVDFLCVDQKNRPGDFAQALMDLGAAICTPKSPSCILCPISKKCAALSEGISADLPYKKKKQEKQHRKGRIFWVRNEKGQILVHKRPDKGLLASMNGFPACGWDKANDTDSFDGLPKILSDFIECHPEINIKNINSQIRHVFTHFSLELDCYTVDIKEKNIDLSSGGTYFWVDDKKIDDTAFPTVFKKMVTLMRDDKGNDSKKVFSGKELS